MNLEKYVEQKMRNDVFDKSLDKKAEDEDKINGYQFRSRCTDSLFCFYQYSKQWMDQTNGEVNLKFEQWLDYFNANKAFMVTRYSKLKDQLKAVDTECLAQEKKRQEQEIKNWRTEYTRDSSNVVNKSSQEQMINSQVKELSITNLGIWNCDQIQRLKDPVYVKKQYKDDKGNLLEPIIVYVIDKSVNGTLTYNGYMDLSPYYFPVSSNSENTILAFDINNKAYICNSKRFKVHLNEPSDALIILEKLKKPEEDLKNNL